MLLPSFGELLSWLWRCREVHEYCFFGMKRYEDNDSSRCSESEHLNLFIGVNYWVKEESELL